MGDATAETPKPMLMIAGKPGLEYKLEALPDEIDEIIIVTGHKEHVIRDHFGTEYKGRPITYVYQEVLNGTAGAVWAARSHLKGDFLVIYGDDIYAAQDIAACLTPTWSMLVKETQREGARGLVEVNDAGNVVSVVGRVGEGPGIGWISAAVYRLDLRFFDYPLTPTHEQHGRVEYGLPHLMVAIAAKAPDITIKAVPATTWIQITTPEDIVRAEEVLSVG
jgi:NDP-sugar pyrophosphorylase family protein